jgi:predicted dithiol-disulfide oxidoreductase (DUF899 family)
MTKHDVGTREEWQAARDELLRREKEHTRMGDELARQRRELSYSTQSRGLEFLMAFYPILDRAPMGRSEEGESEAWIRRHDEYGPEER